MHADDVLVIVLLGAICAGCGGANDAPSAPPDSPLCDPRISSIGIAGAESVTVRRNSAFTATPRDTSGGALAVAITWSSSDTLTALVSPGGTVTGLAAGAATVTATAGCGRTASRAVIIAQSALPVRGLYVQFEQRGWSSGYWSGQFLRALDSTDAIVGTSVLLEAAAQLDAIRTIGVNTIAFELRATEATESTEPFVPPGCQVGLALGLRWPQPNSLELQNLVRFLDLAQTKGLKVMLRLVNTHMEERPATNATAWLGAILPAIKDHPALDLVLFEGDVKIHSENNSCGIPAEPALYLGPTSQPVVYVRWAIGYALSLGMDPRKVSAQAQVGFPLLDEQSPSGPNATDSHLWNPLAVMKGIFDGLGVADANRTYAMSFYEHRKCSGNAPVGCVDVEPHAWAEQTARGIFTTIGKRSAARVVAVEMGVLPDENWTAEQSVQSLVPLMRKYGMEGGAFWRWVNFETAEDGNASLPNAIKRRGVAYAYNPVRAALMELYMRP